MLYNRDNDSYPESLAGNVIVALNQNRVFGVDVHCTLALQVHLHTCNKTFCLWVKTVYYTGPQVNENLCHSA